MLMLQISLQRKNLGRSRRGGFVTKESGHPCRRGCHQSIPPLHGERRTEARDVSLGRGRPFAIDQEVCRRASDISITPNGQAKSAPKQAVAFPFALESNSARPKCLSPFEAPGMICCRTGISSSLGQKLACGQPSATSPCSKPVGGQ
jgi:hypothetical protein